MNERSIFKNLGAVFCLVLLAGTAQAELNLANGAASGAWYNPARDGEGFWVEVVTSGDQPRIVITMYSYDSEGKQLWLQGSTTITEDAVAVTIPVDLFDGPAWGSRFDPEDMNKTPFGNIVARFPTCNSALFDVQSEIPGLDGGIYSHVRLTQLVGLDCVEPAPPDEPSPPGSTEITAGLWTGPGVCFFVNAEGTKIIESDSCDNGNAFSADIPGGQVDLDGRFKPDLCDASVVCDGAWPINSSEDSNGVKITQAICANTAGGIGEIRFHTGSKGFVRAYQGLDTVNGHFCYGPNTDVTPVQ